MVRSCIRISLLGVLVLFAAAASAESQIYRWEDDKGDMHLVSDLNDVPPQYREAAIASTKMERGTLNIVEGIDDVPPPSPVVTQEPAAQPPATPAPAADPEDPEDLEESSGGYYDDERIRRLRAHEARSEGAEHVAPHGRGGHR